jgi:hypothetical protein
LEAQFKLPKRLDWSPWFWITDRDETYWDHSIVATSPILKQAPSRCVK